jgi:hypothetical protein
MPISRCPCENADECPFTPTCPVEMNALGMTVTQANDSLSETECPRCKNARESCTCTTPELVEFAEGTLEMLREWVRWHQ